MFLDEESMNEIMQMQGRRQIGLYLGGPVTELMGTSPSYAADWRVNFPKVLESMGGDSFVCHDPCEGTYNPETLEFIREESNKWRFTDEFILDRCIHQMMASDILIFNFLECEKYYSPGTFWEIGFTFALKTKYTILIDKENGPIRNHPIIKLSTNFVASNLYEAAQYCLYLESKMESK